MFSRTFNNTAIISRTFKKRKLSENSPILVNILDYTMCISYTLLKGVSHYNLSVLSMSVIYRKKFGQGGGCGELYLILF